MVLTREQILAAPDADDDSPDWGRWSMAKCERERNRIPEIDAHFREQEAELERWFERHTEAMRLVDPGYKPASRLHATAVYAILAQSFNMTPDDVRNLSLTDIYGLVRAYCQTVHPKLSGDMPASTDNHTASDLVTMDQAAAVVGLSKRTLERDLSSGKLPDPDLPGGGGKAHRWYWRNLRPALQEHYRPDLPAKFPASRIVG